MHYPYNTPITYIGNSYFVTSKTGTSALTPSDDFHFGNSRISHRCCCPRVAESTLSSAVSRSPVVSRPLPLPRRLPLWKLSQMPSLSASTKYLPWHFAPGHVPGVFRFQSCRKFHCCCHPRKGTSPDLSLCTGLYLISSFCLLVVLTESYHGHHCQCNG